MKRVTESQLIGLIQMSWRKLKAEEFNAARSFQLVLGGEIRYEAEIPVDDHQIFSVILKNPEYDITDSQLCQIMDEGNHCLSEGSIFYEGDRAYILWSNQGHI